MPSTPRIGSLISSPDGSNVVAFRTVSAEAVESAASADPFAIPPGFCPKCITRLGGMSSSCGSCGLLFEKFDPAIISVPQALATLWTNLLKDWGNELSHVHFREQASFTGLLAGAGRLYRIRLAWLPDDPFAVRGRDEIVKMATVPVLTRPPEPHAEKTGTTKLVVAVVIVLIAIAGMAQIVMTFLKAKQGQ